MVGDVDIRFQTQNFRVPDVRAVDEGAEEEEGENGKDPGNR